MKLHYAVVAMLLAGLLVLGSVGIAEAQWDALSSGFAVTTNYHGIDLMPGLDSVTATAGWAPALAPETLRNVNVTTVEFVWHYPNGTVAFSETVPISGPLMTPDDLPPAPIPPEISEWAQKYPGVEHWYAQSTPFIPTVVGDWGVQAIFHDTVKICGKNSDTVRIRATSFNVVPEVPFGTIAILLGWIGILGVFVLRKKHIPA